MDIVLERRQLNPTHDVRDIDRILNEAIQPARHQLGDQQRPAPARQRVRVHVLDAVVAGAEAPEQVSKLRGERRVDPGELGGQFVALSPGLLVGRTSAIVLLARHGRLEKRPSARIISRSVMAAARAASRAYRSLATIADPGATRQA